MSYRVEVSANNRAGCQATVCKKEGIKIKTGEIRQGTLVTIQEHTSMRWRHWGCVTPKVLHNWRESSGMDTDLIDGFDDLPDDAKEKVKRALEQCHVDDEDWNGDAEMNRYNAAKPMQGMFVKTPKKKSKDESDDEMDSSPTKKKATKKRARATADDEDDIAAEPAPKKTKKGKAAKANESEDAPSAKKGKKGRQSKEDSNDIEPAPAPTTKKGKGKKAKSAAVVEADIDLSAAEDVPPPAKKGKAKKGSAKAAPAADAEEAVTKAKPQRRRGRKAASDDA